MKVIKQKTNKILRIIVTIALTVVSLNIPSIPTVQAASTLVPEVKLTHLETVYEKVSISGLGISNLYNIEMGGQRAFCMDNELHASIYNTYTYGGRVTNHNSIQALNWFNLAGYYPSRYQITQAIIWCAEKGIPESSRFATVQYILRAFGWSNKDIIDYNIGDVLDQIDATSSSGTYYYYITGSNYDQRIVTVDTPNTYKPVIYTKDIQESITVGANETVNVQINKTDASTGNGLAGVKFDIYKDGTKATTLTTNVAGKATHEFKNSFNQTVQSDVITYVTNYSSLAAENQDYVRRNYKYWSYSTAKAAAVKNAQDKAANTSTGSGQKHAYKAIETATKTGYVLDRATNTFVKEITGSGTFTVNATNKQQTGAITVTKLDSKTNAPLDGAVYGIYATTTIPKADGSGTLYVKDQHVATLPPTDLSGKATYSGLALGSYYIKEIKAPTDYVVNTTKYPFTLSYKGSSYTVTDTQSLTVTNTYQTGSMNVTKLDRKTNAPLDGAIYGLYAKENISTPDKSSIAYKAGTLVSTLPATNNVGYTSISGLYLGEYYIQEITAPINYVINNTKYPVSLTYKGQDFTVTDTKSQTVTNDSQRGSVTMTKTDKETKQPIQGAIFTVYAKETIIHPDGKTGVLFQAGDVVATLPPTDAAGQTSISDLYLGNYYIQETTAPEGYVLKDTTYDFSLTYAGQEASVAASVTTTSTNTPQRVEIALDKKDVLMENYDDQQGNSNNSNIVDFNKDGAQGDATLQGAIYGLYAREDITYFDVTNNLVTYNDKKGSNEEITLLKGTDLTVYEHVATAGTLLATAKTNQDGEVSFGHLYNGQYYIQEVAASTGYLLDDTQYNIDASYTLSNTKVPTIHKSTDVFEVVKKQAFEIAKYGMNSQTGAILKPLEGIEFEIQLESDIQALLAQGKSLKEAKLLAPVYDTLVTDNKGNDTSIELPYGKYRITETKTLGEYQFADDFFITINEDNREPLAHEIFGTVINHEFEAMIKVVKEDKETGKQVAISGATYKIKNLDSGHYIGYWNNTIYPYSYVTEFVTNKDGFVYVDNTFSTGNYQLEEVKAPTGYTIDKTPIPFTIGSKETVTVAPNGITPVITVIQKNVSVKGQIEVEKQGEVLVAYENGNFVYETKGLQGAIYEVIAKEDILDPSNDKTVLIKKDTVADTITTAKNGKAISKKLPLGSYYVKEKTAPEGFILSNEKQDVTLTYKDQNTAVVFDNANYVNDRQKVEVTATKQDSETNTYLAGMEVTIYANKDITNYAGKVIITKGTKLQTITTNNKGTASFDLDLPTDFEGTSNKEENSMFKVIETKAPTGYVGGKITHYVDTTYTNQEQKAIEFTTTFFNKETTTLFSKTDVAGKEVEGAKITVTDKDGTIIDEWISTNENHIVRGLEYGKEYTMTEVLAPDQYTKATSINFVFEKDLQKVSMIDTQVEIAKIDTTTGNLLKDVTFDVIEMVHDKEIVVDTFTTDGTATYYVNNLVVGHTYTIRETKAPTGFVQMDDVTFTVVSNEDLYIELDNTTYIDIHKVDSETLTQLPDATLEVFYEDQEGNEVIVETFTTTDTAHRITGLVTGQTYYLREVASPDGYYYSDEVLEFMIGKDLNVVYKNEVVTTEFIKVDTYTKDKVTGATLEIYKVLEDGTTRSIEQFITSEDNYIIKGLIEGNTYYLHEIKAPTGYILSDDVISFIAGKDLSVTLKNAPIKTSIQVNKVDSKTKEAIKFADFTFTMYSDKECTHVLAVVNANTKDGTATFKDLLFGTYYIKETKAPTGYKLSDEVKEIIINDQLEGVGTTHSVTYENTALPVVNTADNTNPLSYTILLLTALLSINQIINKKKIQNII